MKILIIAPACAPNRSGLALRVFKWIQMIKGEAEVSYFSTCQQEDPKIAHRFRHQDFPDYWTSKIKKLWTYYKTDFEKMEWREKPDIVQIHTPYFFALKKFFPNTPVVLVEHDVNWNLLKYDMMVGPGLRRLPFQFPLIPWLQWRAKKFEKNILKKASHTFVCSPVDKEEILKALPELAHKITVIPNCLDVASYTPSEKRGETCLFMGSMSYSANLDAIDQICQKLAPALPHIPFQILGSGTYTKSHPNNVHFLGHVKEIKPYVENCRLFIAPLRFGSGTRWKILEAFAMQRPVIATPKGAEGLAATHGKNIWIEEKETAFINAIRKLWEEEAKAKELAWNGRKLVAAQYDYHLYASQVIQVYRNLLREGEAR